MVLYEFEIPLLFRMETHIAYVYCKYKTKGNKYFSVQKIVSNTEPKIITQHFHKISTHAENNCLIIITARQNFFARGSQDQGVFVLCHVGARHIHQRRVGSDQASLAQLLHGCHIVCLLALQSRSNIAYEKNETCRYHTSKKEKKKRRNYKRKRREKEQKTSQQDPNHPSLNTTIINKQQVQQHMHSR
jgi:hypothetical protein